MRVHVHAGFDTPLSPENVVAALTDFSEARLATWPTLDPAKYRLHEQGDTWAVATEGTKHPSVWSRERYDWSEPGRVSWKSEASNFCAPGGGIDLRVTPTEEGGSSVEMDWQRSPTTLRGYFIALAFALFGKRVLTTTYKPVFDALSARKA